MNESLAKQLHELMKTYKINIIEEVNFSLRNINNDFEKMENDVNKLIKNNENIGKQND